MLPSEITNKLAQKLLEKLTSFRKSPEVYIDGPLLAGQALRSMAPEKEALILDKLREENPEEAELIARKHLQFEDICILPKEILSLVFTDLDISECVKALKEWQREKTGYILSLIPPKKADIIRRDVEGSIIQVTKSEQWKTRRFIVQRLEQQLEKDGISLAELWAQVEDFDRKGRSA
jgi:flagellar motor switch protein FliG